MEDAFQGQGQNLGELAPIERQLVGYFTNGLYYDYLKIKVMRENPKRTKARCSNCYGRAKSMKAITLRTGRQYEEHAERQPIDREATLLSLLQTSWPHGGHV